MISLYALQAFGVAYDEWKTVNVSLDIEDMKSEFNRERAYDEYFGLSFPYRVVRFTVDDLEFISTHARDFEVIEQS